ncbi:MAG: DNA internalization-related competence protein ComEC/Rec2 [Lachnospiraceae bacterium]|nr:DNA internalization-related competence protein ComEC/Rec2 [Lachnospiraceae bacterium]
MKRPACFAALCLVCLLFLISRLKPPEIFGDEGLSGMPAQAYGTLSDKYEKNGSFCLILSDARLITGKKPETEKHDIIVKLSDTEDPRTLPHIGQMVLVKGKIYIFDRARNPGQFDLALYEKSRGIDLELTGAQIKKVLGREAVIRESLNRLSFRISTVYDALYGEEDAGIIKAMVLGDKNAMDQEIKALYTRAGAAHVLCISGLHISLLGCFFYRGLKRCCLPRAPAAIISTAFLTAYAVMTGMSVSAKRAVIMFSLLIIADCIGRSYDLLSSLSVSGCILLLSDPYMLFDTAFVMSFGAVMGAGILKPALDRLFPGKNKAVDAVKLSLSITVFSLPVTLYSYFQVPVYSVFLNLIIVPLMGVLLITALLAGGLGLIFLPLGIIPAKAGNIILGFYEGVCRINDKLPYSLLIKGRPCLFYMIIYYLLLIMLVILIKRYVRPGGSLPVKAGRAILCLCGFIMLMVLPVNMIKTPSVTMLDIGQGDCACIETGRGRVVMIDCGSSDESMIAKYKVLPFLKSRGRSCIDAAVVTHADNDHISGFKELFEMPEKEGLKVKRLIMPDTALKDEAYASLVKLAKSRGTKVTLIKTGDEFTVDGISFYCLHPDRGYECADRNEYSTVLSVSFGGFDALFTGDVEGRGEEILTERISKRYTLLKCAHHGSDNSTPEEFLERVSPKITFISAGRGNSYGHPGKELIKRLRGSGTGIYVTKDSGALMLSTDGKKMKVETFLKGVGDAERQIPEETVLE